MIATPDSMGTIRFPPPLTPAQESPLSLPQGVYGGHLLVIPQEPANSSTSELKVHVTKYLSTVFGQKMEFLWLFDSHFQESLTWESSDGVTYPAHAELRLIRITVPLAKREWLSFPDILRSLPKTRLRIPYLRMFQILMGQHEERTEAVDTEQLKKILLKDETH